VNRIFLFILVFCASALSAQGGGYIAVHGHRGTRGTRPENTLPAFEEALRVGADASITDYPADLINYLKAEKLR